jgi:hypothetical protein
MVGTVQSLSQSTAQTTAPQNDPRQIAAKIVTDNSPGGKLNLSGVRSAIDSVKAQDPTLGAEVQKAVEAQLTPVQRGQLASAAYSVKAPDGGTITFNPTAPTVAQDFAKPADAGRAALYARFDKIWGDGNAKTNDVAKIEAGLSDLRASGLSLADYEARQAAAPNAEGGPTLGSVALDVTQVALDIVGIFEPTPFADLSNAAISVARGDWWGAGLSVVGVVPYAGDLAKLGKMGKWAKTVANAVELAASSPAARKALEPALRKIADAVNGIPDSALKALPDDARKAIEGMKKQLDEFFGAGPKLSDIPVSKLSRDTIISKLDTLDVSSKPNTAIFYSGRGGREAAENYAKAGNLTVLENTPGGKYLDDLKLFDGTVKDVDPDAAMDIWGKISTRYAEQASGSVTALINNPRPNSVFLTQELPALLKNGNVTELIVRSGSGAQIAIPKGTSLEAALEMIGKLK